jgi:hypothetical protein
MSLFRREPLPAPPPPPEGALAEFITLTIPGEHLSRWTLKPNAQWSALIDTLFGHLAAVDTGEIRYMESLKDAALVYLDRPNAEQLFTNILPLLQASSLCRRAGRHRGGRERKTGLQAKVRSHYFLIYPGDFR